jgi:hypothetical protein
MNEIDKTIKQWGKCYCDAVRRCLGNNESQFRAHVGKVLGVNNNRKKKNKTNESSRPN